MCRRKLGFNCDVFILICIIPFMLTSNAFKFCTLNSVVQNPFCLLSRVRPLGHYDQWVLLGQFDMFLVV
jgi:hypothetical protein